MINIVPVDDLKEHELISTCACTPKIEEVEGGEILIIHNAYDGRIAVEMANEFLSLPNTESKGWLIRRI